MEHRLKTKKFTFSHQIGESLMKKDYCVVYSNVWEDPELNRRALSVAPGESVLSITSGGCNSLCLLLENPGRVVSIDLNPAQLSMLEFKRAAIMELDYDNFLESMGTPFYRKPSPYLPDYRIALYRKIRGHMPEYARQFWDNNTRLIGKGIFMCGKVEHFFAFYRKALGFLYNFSIIEDLFRCPDIDEQTKMYRRFNKKRWRFLNSMLLNRFVLSIVKGAHSFAQVDDKNLSENLNRKIDKGMTSFLNSRNFFMSLMLLGEHYSRMAMSPYLLEENFTKLKANVKNLEIFRGTIGDVLSKYGPQSFDAFNLSNIFEWMTDAEFNDVIREVVALSRARARHCFRYTLARPRSLDEANKERLKEHSELAKTLFDLDRSFIYESFHVYSLI